MTWCLRKDTSNQSHPEVVFDEDNANTNNNGNDLEYPGSQALTQYSA